MSRDPFTWLESREVQMVGSDRATYLRNLVGASLNLVILPSFGAKAF